MRGELLIRWCIALFVIWIPLFFRFIYIEISIEEIFAFSFVYFLGSGIFLISILRFATYINPITVYFPFILCLSISFINFSDDKLTYSLTTIFVLLFSILSYAIGALIDIKLITIKSLTIEIKWRKLILYLVVLFGFLTFCGESLLLGYVPVFNIFSKDVYNESNKTLIPFFHYFILLLALVPSWGYVFFKRKQFSKIKYGTLLLIVFFVLSNYLSKQIYLMMTIVFLFTYIHFNSISLKKIVWTFVGLISLFTIMANLRLDTDLGYSLTEYYKLIANISNPKVSFLEAAISEYNNERFVVLNELIERQEHDGYFAFGINTFKPIISLLLLEKLGLIVRPPEYDTENLVATFLADPFLDFWYIGVVVINLLYGFMASYYYKKLKLGEVEGSISFGLISFCLLMGMFVNFFNTIVFWFGLIFTKLIVGNGKR